MSCQVESNSLENLKNAISVYYTSPEQSKACGDALSFLLSWTLEHAVKLWEERDAALANSPRIPVGWVRVGDGAKAPEAVQQLLTASWTQAWECARATYDGEAYAPIFDEA